MKRYIVQVNNNKYEVFIKETDEKSEDSLIASKSIPDKLSTENKDNNSLQNNIASTYPQASNITPLLAPMSGKVLSINTEEGIEVKKGDVLITIEAMKMETEINAHVSGVITKISATIGDNCKRNDILLHIKEDGED